MEGNDQTHTSLSEAHNAEDARVALHRHIRQVIDQNRQRLLSHEARVDRGLDAIRLAQEHAQREHAEIERYRAARHRNSTPQPSINGPARPTEVVDAEELSRVCAFVAAKVADTEERVARTHEELASKRSDKAAAYLETARQAREQMRRAREAERHFRRRSAAKPGAPSETAGQTAASVTSTSTNSSGPG